MARRLVQLHLNRWGVACDLVEDGAELLAELRKRKYSVAIIDGAMPSVSGIEAVAAIRSGQTGEHHRDMMIVAHSGQAELRAAFRQAGADWFIEKPLYAETLHQALAMARVLPPSQPRLGFTACLRPHSLSPRTAQAIA